MTTSTLKLISDSAEDFANIVWPHIIKTPLVGGGTLLPVEAQTSEGFSEILDVIAGIDVLQFSQAPLFVRGIASRVQWHKCYRSFSIRTVLKSGQETEIQKRLNTIKNLSSTGGLFPFLTVQAYISEPKGKLLAAAVIKTQELLGIAEYLYQHKQQNKLKTHPSLYNFITNEDGSEFMYLSWKYLIHKGVLKECNVIDLQATEE